MQLDRFIPSRSGLNLDAAHYQLYKENDNTAESSSPSQARTNLCLRAKTDKHVSFSNQRRLTQPPAGSKHSSLLAGGLLFRSSGPHLMRLRLLFANLDVQKVTSYAAKYAFALMQGAYKQRLADSMLNDDQARILSFKHKVCSCSSRALSSPRFTHHNTPVSQQEICN